MSEHKVIFHIDELNKWKLLLKNVSNLLDVVGIEKFYIEILANSEAVKVYTTNTNLEVDINSMVNLNSKGVTFVACNNSLIAYDIKKDDILDFIHIVPVGVLELINKQSDGYAYLKP